MKKPFPLLYNLIIAIALFCDMESAVFEFCMPSPIFLGIEKTKAH